MPRRTAGQVRGQAVAGQRGEDDQAVMPGPDQLGELLAELVAHAQLFEVRTCLVISVKCTTARSPVCVPCEVNVVSYLLPSNSTLQLAVLLGPPLFRLQVADPLEHRQHLRRPACRSSGCFSWTLGAALCQTPSIWYCTATASAVNSSMILLGPLR